MLGNVGTVFMHRCNIRCLSTLITNDLYSSTKIFSSENKSNFIAHMDKIKLDFSLKFNKKTEKQAGILIPLCEVNNKPSILFTQRSAELRTHKGQVSFPGGIADESDTSIIDTSLRETEEEIGLHRNRVDVWCTTPILPDQRFKVGVTGVVGFIGEIDVEELSPNYQEVASIFTVPIDFLADRSSVRYTKFRIKPMQSSKWNYSSPVYLTDPRVWGLSACFLDLALQCLISSYKPVPNIFLS